MLAVRGGQRPCLNIERTDELHGRANRESELLRLPWQANDTEETLLPWMLRTISMMPNALGEPRVAKWKSQALEVFDRSSSQQSRIEAINLLASCGTLPSYEIIRDILRRCRRPHRHPARPRERRPHPPRAHRRAAGKVR